MTSQRDVKKLKMIRFILHAQKTTYAEIAQALSISNKTVAKYLDMINQEVTMYDVELVRKPSEGVYFLGDIQKLSENLQPLSLNLTDAKEERMLYVFSRLVLSSGYVTIQQLADELYVSRGTLENMMKEVTALFRKNQVELIKNRNGLRVLANEAQRRGLIAKLINFYWGNLSYKESVTYAKGRTVELPCKVKAMFDEQLLDTVIGTLNTFCNESMLDVTEYEFQSLAIHLVIAIDRIRKNQYLSSDVKKYELEKNTVLLVGMLEEAFSFLLPEYEKYYINIHMLAIQKTTLTKLQINEETEDFAYEVRDIIVDALKNWRLDEEVLDGLVLHLTSAIKRLYLGLSISNPFTEEIKRNFPQAFEESLQIRQKIIQRYGIDMNDEECAFIALHLGSFFERIKEAKQKIDVILVCSSGIGTSRLLEQRIKKTFANEMNITRVVSLATLDFDDIDEDLIISTVNITASIDVPMIVVSPFLYELDIQSIRSKLTAVDNYFVYNKPFMKLIDSNFIWIANKKETKAQVITKIGEQLLEKKCAIEGVIDSAMEREELSSTAHEMIALPHAGVDFITSPRISVYINKKGIVWDEDSLPVKVVFFFAINQEVREHISGIYEFFTEFIDDKKQLSRLVEANETSAVIEVLKGE